MGRRIEFFPAFAMPIEIQVIFLFFFWNQIIRKWNIFLGFHWYFFFLLFFNIKMSHWKDIVISFIWPLNPPTPLSLSLSMQDISDFRTNMIPKFHIGSILLKVRQTKRMFARSWSKTIRKSHQDSQAFFSTPFQFFGILGGWCVWESPFSTWHNYPVFFSPFSFIFHLSISSIEFSIIYGLRWFFFDHSEEKSNEGGETTVNVLSEAQICVKLWENAIRQHNSKAICVDCHAYCIPKGAFSSVMNLKQYPGILQGPANKTKNRE